MERQYRNRIILLLKYFKEEKVTDKIIKIESQDGRLLVGSRLIAEHFEKEHKVVLRKIDGIIAEINSAQNCAQYFLLSEYQDSSGKSNREYFMTRDGFSLLVMGFTGRKALEWKLRYIDAFNKMEEALKNQNSKMLPRTYKEALIQLIDQVEENEKLVEENQLLLPKAEYHDEVLNKDGLITTSLVAKDLGLRSATQLNQVLYLSGIIFKDKDGVWKPYADCNWLIVKGYADYQSYKDPNAKQCLKWTEKGRKYILENYSKWEASVQNE